MIVEIAFFGCPVTVMPRARRFDEELIGFKVEHGVRTAWSESGIAGAGFADLDGNEVIIHRRKA